MVRRLTVILAVVTVQGWCAGTHKTLVDAKVEGVLELSKDTVMENNHPAPDARDSVSIANHSSDTLLMDSIYIAFDTSKIKDFGPTVVFQVGPRNDSLYSENYVFRPAQNRYGTQLFRKIRILPNESITLYNFFTGCDPVVSAPANSNSSFQDTVLKIVFMARGDRDTLVLIGPIESCLTLSRPAVLIRTEPEKAIANPSYFSVQGKRLPGILKNGIFISARNATLLPLTWKVGSYDLELCLWLSPALRSWPLWPGVTAN